MKSNARGLIANTTIAWCLQAVILGALAWNIAGFVVGASLPPQALPWWAHPEGGQFMAFIILVAAFPFSALGTMVSYFLAYHLECFGKMDVLAKEHPVLFKLPYTLGKVEFGLLLFFVVVSALI